MKRFCLFLCGLCVVPGIALAQEKSNVQWKCDKPTVQHNIDVGDKPGHAYAIDQINCTAIKGEIAGVKMKSGTGTEFLDVKGDKTTGHGEFVEAGPAEDIFYRPQHPYTRMLLDAMPRLDKPNRPGHIALKPLAAADNAPTLLTVDDVKVHFPIRMSGTILPKYKALRAVDGCL